MAKLPHIKNSEVTAEMAEAIYSALFEAQFMPPAGVVMPSHIDEQITNISGLDTLEAAPGTVQQNYKLGQKRQFTGLATSNIHNVNISLNLNLHGPDTNDPVLLNGFNAWNAKRKNPKTAAMSLKKTYCGQWVLTQFNQVGTVWRLVTYKFAWPSTRFSGIDGANPTGDDIYSGSVTITSELADVNTVGQQF